ncbi:MAG: amino acid permease, partial [Bacteroidota bacterium]
GRVFISITIFASVLGFMNAMLLSVPRMYFAMAEDGVIPVIFKQINPQTQVQEFSLTFFLLVSIGSLFLLKNFNNILNYVMVIDSLAMGLGAASIFILRKRQPQFDGFQIPFYPVLPALFVLFLLGISISVFFTDLRSALYGTGLLLLGGPLYWLAMRLRSRS